MKISNVCYYGSRDRALGDRRTHRQTDLGVSVIGFRWHEAFSIIKGSARILNSAYVRMSMGAGIAFYQPLSAVLPARGRGPHGVEYAWHVCYGYFYIKIIDLLDTVFFLLRKKQNQVTFLHVYHHFGMIAVAWGIVKWVPGGHMTMLVTINSFVHMVMYTYYLLTSWDDSFKYSLWWKKYVTQIQIFSYLMIHFGALLVKRECRFPPQPAYIMFPQNLFMVLMFGDFYYRTYLKTSDKSA
ncbi:hypothetical protein MSG28_007010 [Choristoneura fumiferana]|uniref:Uncharacterized protein n=1 Tax=Choristoneura fumiferana TaxID=7141 RepID=A0ACC0JM01_CHOFU|nr:hypothetical protein MSG28_007010 [Choristoneura fumiferana]